MVNVNYAYYREIVKEQVFPLAFVDLDLFDANVKQIIQQVKAAQTHHNQTVRIASKSLRCLPLIQRIFAADALFQGLMCFSPQEALCLSQAGLDDLLLGYPCWHSEQIQALAREIQAGKTIILMVDSVAHIQHLEQIAAQVDVVLPVCLDIDMSVDFPALHFGVWRSSVTDVESAVAVYDAIAASPHIRLDGVMGYEAQIAGVGDAVPQGGLKNRLIRLLKSRSIPQIAERRAAIVAALTERGAQLRLVNGGGTGSIHSTLAEAVVTEVTVGSGFYAPKLFDYYHDFQFKSAAAYAIQIVRQPRNAIYTCHGGGYIASGSVGADKAPQVYLPEGATLNGLEGAGEVQTPIHYQGRESLAIGDPIFMRHSKAGELCERFNRVLLISDGAIVDEVDTYRGQGWCFL